MMAGDLPAPLALHDLPAPLPPQGMLARRSALIEALQRSKQPSAPKPKHIKSLVAFTPAHVAPACKQAAVRRERHLHAAPPKPPQPKPRVDQTMAIPVGLWVEYTMRGGSRALVEILGHVTPGQPVPDLSSGRLLSGHGTVSTCARYLVRVPAVGAKEMTHYRLVQRLELERNILTIHADKPATERLDNPIPDGTFVVWESAGGGNVLTRHGDIIAYVPAGTSIRSLVPHVTIRPQDDIQDVSIRDRYLVDCDRRTGNGRACYSAPIAIELERGQQVGLTHSRSERIGTH